MAKRPSFYHHLHPPRIPAREARFRHTFGLGGISFYLFLVLVISGALELFYYVPSPDQANRSLQLITHLVPFGLLIRSVHYWAAQILVVTSVLHMLRVALSGAYKPPRRFNWLLGLCLLVLVLFLDFTGYALRWDEDIAWALLVGTNLIRSIPLIGTDLYQIVVGGSKIASATVVRFYGWHVLGLSLVAAILVVWHSFRVRRDGGIARLSSRITTAGATSRDELVRREALAALATTILLILIALMFPPSLGPAADFQDLPSEASAPWFFLWIQQTLSFGSPFAMGILVPAGMLFILALVPYLLDRKKEGSAQWFNPQGGLARVVVLAILIFVLGFIVKGALK